MKTSVKNIFALALTVVTLSVSAFTASANEVTPSYAGTSYGHVITQFLDSYKHNNAKVLASVLSDNASYKYNRANAVKSYSAKELVKFVKNNQGLTYQNFKQKVSLVSQSDALVIAKIELNEGDKNASDQYITLEKGNNGDWKITQINQIYK